MKEHFVQDTVVLTACSVPNVDGSTLRLLEIAYGGEPFAPGQFVMVAGREKTMSWPAPFPLQKRTPRGITILVPPQHPFFRLREGDAVTLWGPNGTGIDDGPFTVLTDAVGWPLILPVLTAHGKSCKGISIHGEDSHIPEKFTQMGTTYPIHPLKRLENTVNQCDLWQAEKVIVALPLAKLAAWKKTIPVEKESQVMVYVGTRIGCGVGACRGCHIHSDRFPQGLPVCQEGPFLPLNEVDYKRDQNFMDHFQLGGVI